MINLKKKLRLKKKIRKLGTFFLLVLGGCASDNNKQSATELQTIGEHTAPLNSALLKGLKDAIQNTHYAALIVHTAVEALPINNAGLDSAGQQRVFSADVIETFVGAPQDHIRYIMNVEVDEDYVLNKSTQIVTLCRDEEGYYWPGTGSLFPGNEQVVQQARLIVAEQLAAQPVSAERVKSFCLP